MLHRLAAELGGLCSIAMLLSALTLTSADRAFPEDEGARVLGESGEKG